MTPGEELEAREQKRRDAITEWWARAALREFIAAIRVRSQQEKR